MAFTCKFWGTRGSIAVSSSRHVRFGGNTSCVEIDVGDRRLVLDAGTGIHPMGMTHLNDDVREIQLFLTHTHWDHINGFPFLAPAYDPKRSIHIMAGHLKDRGGVEEVLARQMDGPMFPIPIEAMQAEIRFEDFEAGDAFNVYPDVKMRTMPLRHPNSATGYRVEYEGKSVCYITDTEHIPGEPDQNVLDLIEGANLVIYDCTYTEEEFPRHIGWGHSTWEEGIRMCKAANAKRLCIFHHEPNHDDDFMDALEAEAREAWSETFCARDYTNFTID
jgi:phosphoribosyl 1,2-cyclic phosphodiesterase